MKDKELINDLINIVNELEKARNDLYLALCEMENYQNKMNDIETSLILNNKITGKNEKERNAVLSSLMFKENETQLKLKQKVRLQQVTVDNLVDRLKTFRLIGRIIARETYTED